jgi:serine/threonine protein kinase
MSTGESMDWEVFYARFREPDFVPGYEIHNRLGGGAFGEVYKARKASIGKSYAIKFLKIDDDHARDAAVRELEQVRHFAALDHPNLVSIEDMGTAAGVPYLIMGYAGEDTLARRLKQGTLDEATALLFFVQVCRGVLALHDRRLVHFDLKPSNVFLKGDVARVGDYGLSKMMTDGRSTLSFGRGTPQYMAPEMLKNRADHRADVYSLGVILYECLTGAPPYAPSVPGAFDLREDDRPPPFPPAFPARLRPVVTSCLRLRPEDRYASVADLLAALGHTARLGDSVRLSPPAEPRPAPRAPEPGTARSEARNTAAELTRGAMEVARGVLDGLRSTPPTPTRTGTVPSVTSLPPTPTSPVVPHAPPPVPLLPASAELVSAGPALKGGGRESSDVLVLHTLRDVNSPPPALAAEGAATIPVPPPVPGGWLGTLYATLLLALEVLLSLSRWLFAALKRAITRGGGAAKGGLRRFVGGAARLFLFLLFLAILGGLTTLGAYLLLRDGAGT